LCVCVCVCERERLSERERVMSQVDDWIIPKNMVRHLPSSVIGSLNALNALFVCVCVCVCIK